MAAMTTQTSEKYYERYDGMPIPPIKENMQVFDAGAVSIGVEYRVLNDAVVDSLGLAATAASNGYPTLDDNGVSLHVFVRSGGGNFERLRFDCFQRDPHYHYFSLKTKTQDVIHIDPNVTGDVVAWALSMLRTRLALMLQRADVDDAGKLVDFARVEQVLPLVTEAAYRARYHSDRKHTEQSALTRGNHLWETGESRSWERHSQV
jgi:hypothetical protein